jgi:hypothetical protein
MGLAQTNSIASRDVAAAQLREVELHLVTAAA